MALDGSAVSSSLLDPHAHAGAGMADLAGTLQHSSCICPPGGQTMTKPTAVLVALVAQTCTSSLV